MTDKKYDYMSIVDNIFSECKTISDVNFRFIEMHEALNTLFNQTIALKAAEDRIRRK